MVSPVRLDGLASGLDTTQMVKDLMKAEKAPLNKLLQKKQSEEWTRDQYRDMNVLLLDLQKTTFDMKLQGSYLKKTMTSDNEAIVSAKQKGTPSLASYDVEVTTLPQSGKAASVKFVNNMADDSTAIGEAFGFKIGAATIDVTATDTIASVISKINATSATTGITAAYLKDDKSITFTTSAADSTAAISIDVVSPATTFGTSNNLNLSVGTINKTTNSFAPTASQSPQDAAPGSVMINGITHAVNGSTLMFDGIEMNLKSVGKTKINVKPDEDAIFNSIKSFVDKYNDVISKINGKITETAYKDYKPLLDEEKQALSETQVNQWEDKAKSGLLRQDSLLGSTLNEMRRTLSSSLTGTGVDSKFDTLSEIGITTGAYQEKGKLHIDETKLRQAISENGSNVMDLFTKVSTSSNPDVQNNETGLANRLYDVLKNGISKVTDKAGSALYLTDNSVIGKDLRSMDSNISKWNTRLTDIENRYWKKFTAMETAMNNANSQSSWLSQQFAAQGN
jgi:flagellar hook-associated protein 2